jgi:alanyl-tRNA synthetase
VRRIEAATGLGALALLREQEKTLERVAATLRTSVAELPERAIKLMAERREAEREIEKLRAARHGGGGAVDLTAGAKLVAGVRVLATRVDGADPKELRGLVDQLRQKLGSAVVLLASESDGRVSLALGVTPDLTARSKPGDLGREVAGVVGGKGGGRPDFAQAGGDDPSRLPAAFERLEALVAAGAA